MDVHTFPLHGFATQRGLSLLESGTHHRRPSCPHRLTWIVAPPRSGSSKLSLCFRIVAGLLRGSNRARALALSLSLSLSHTHTHTHTVSVSQSQSAWLPS
jgi:hypothetical protein